MLDNWWTAGRRWWQHMKEQAADRQKQASCALIVRRWTGQMASTRGTRNREWHWPAERKQQKSKEAGGLRASSGMKIAGSGKTAAVVVHKWELDRDSTCTSTGMARRMIVEVRDRTGAAVPMCQLDQNVPRHSGSWSLARFLKSCQILGIYRL